jgi:methionine salvage enolase-phosphatase E1
VLGVKSNTVTVSYIKDLNRHTRQNLQNISEKHSSYAEPVKVQLEWKQTGDANTTVNHMLILSDKDFKVDILKMIQQLITNSLEKLKN